MITKHSCLDKPPSLSYAIATGLSKGRATKDPLRLAESAIDQHVNRLAREFKYMQTQKPRKQLKKQGVSKGVKQPPRHSARMVSEQKKIAYEINGMQYRQARRLEKMVFDLEKDRLIDTRKQLRQAKREVDDKALDLLQSLESDFGNKVLMAKESMAEARKEMAQNADESRRILKQVEKELREDHRRQLELMEELARGQYERIRKQGMEKLTEDLIAAYRRG